MKQSFYANVCWCNVREDLSPWTQNQGEHVFMICRLKWATQTRGYRLPKYLYKTQNTGMYLRTEACRDPQSFVDAPVRMYRKTFACLSAEPVSINRDVLHVWTHHTQGRRQTKSNGPLQTLSREIRTKEKMKTEYGWRGEGGRSQKRSGLRYHALPWDAQQQVTAASVHLSGPVGMGMVGTGECPSHPKRGNLLSFLPWSLCGIPGRCWYSGSSVLQH